MKIVLSCVVYTSSLPVINQDFDYEHAGKQVKVADNKNFITSEEAGKIESQEHYRAILAMYKEQKNAVVAKHDEEIEMNHIQAKLELLDELIELSALKYEKE
ncbi:hypothetical protein IGI04_026321 [Brassica rapa subsp. trilocularis]|uniref:Uncharacterized protein n=3 Tax=Brassica TaxID=3705 RepID=A0A3P6B0Q8_BRACM|nr:hypothetical protein IGI04_026321 [Brassica rapa subsp. trilocularis]CAF2159274.1 unnamed protein product [Brassica napus]CAG7901465.1 unnamed protein product [Brassica rapa]VDC96857.1 unnamed protein product [Brassica rapa]